MFSRQRLIAELETLAAADPIPMDLAEFNSGDGSEQYIRAFRAAKRDCNDGLLFWIKGFHREEWWPESDFAYPRSALCEPICEDEFARLVADYSHSFVMAGKTMPEFLVHLDGYQSGLWMYREWNDMAAVAELAESFVAFRWSTTA